MKNTIINVAHHRNGISGEPFYIVHFREGKTEMYGVIFDPEIEPLHVAVFDKELLAQGIIAFGANSFRGDNFSEFLLDAAKQYDAKLNAAKDGDAIWKVMQGGKAIWGTKRKAA